MTPSHSLSTFNPINVFFVECTNNTRNSREARSAAHARRSPKLNRFRFFSERHAIRLQTTQKGESRAKRYEQATTSRSLVYSRRLHNGREKPTASERPVASNARRPPLSVPIIRPTA